MDIKIVWIDPTETEIGEISAFITSFQNVSLFFFNEYANAKKYLEFHIADIVFLNANYENDVWLEQFEEIKAIDKAILIVVVGDCKQTAVKAFELQAFGFLLRPLKIEKIENILNKAQIYRNNLERNH